MQIYHQLIWESILVENNINKTWLPKKIVVNVLRNNLMVF